MALADNAAVTALSAEDLQWLNGCQAFGLTITVKKTHFMGQGVDSPPDIGISGYKLEVVHDFVYQGSTISDSLSLDTELNKRIGKASTTMSRLTKRVWANNKLTEHTKIQVYRACVLSTLLYSSESWTLHTHQERQLNAYHMHCLRYILDITLQDKVDSILAESPDSSPDEEHEVKEAEATEREERPRVQTPMDTPKSGVKAPEYLQYD
ncbi:uncharacterized protein [Procambarus clarkii]|uniref:uncharacterized protein n=1 Tax=Procambarus clarkii TaxID=6728 RepID=UPI003743ED39